jgi:hypothetical protein
MLNYGPVILLPLALLPTDLPLPDRHRLRARSPLSFSSTEERRLSLGKRWASAALPLYSATSPRGGCKLPRTC